MRALVAALPLLAACATGGSGAAGSQPGRGIDVARYGRLLAMSDERRVDTALIQSILRSGSSPERAAAALAVGQVQARALAPTVRALLVNRDTTLAANAAYALGLLADTGSVAALAQALGAPPAVARNAAWALG
ncbi:MAG: HEAT repeat domain-containing protein, partial [Gemmatimonadota bacterium]|nr:HEAT repeat domain-containing protein [Gemmatimonadota bacterium]